ncbi:MAG TPA: sulfite exporter TauE/SafE family protein [Pyrinomonadaceae bacterium]
MNVTLLHGIAMFAAAFFGGMMNSIAGGGTLLTFPVLLWLGLDPKVANATSTVALWPGLFGGVLGFRRDMENSRSILVRLGATSVIGGGLGAWLLIQMPSDKFARQVPFLILFATALFTLQAPITRWLGTGKPAEKPRARWWTGAIVFQFFSSMYGGYFGAGNGILMLAAMGLLGLTDIHRANGIKNFLGICINFVAIIAFVIAGLVVWPNALLMAVAAIAGGYFGASTARRLGRVFVRRTVVLIGLTIGIAMLIKMKL